MFADEENNTINAMGIYGLKNKRKNYEKSRAKYSPQIQPCLNMP